MTENAEYIEFGDYCREVIGIKSIIGYYFLEGIGKYPNLGNGLRFKGTYFAYPHYMIHKDDATVFKDRVDKWRTHIRE
jgi:hypothetical protein